LIGASWAAAQYLARGFDVIATDPAPTAEADLRKRVDEAWELLTVIGLAPGASRDRLTFTADMKEAASKADFVQESAPERLLLKAKVFAQMDEVAPPDSILASSASGITMDTIQSSCKHPERCVIGHVLPNAVAQIQSPFDGDGEDTRAVRAARVYLRALSSFIGDRRHRSSKQRRGPEIMQERP
jgi:3-hydroxyacyl-CoA dehydrogenase